MLPSACFEITGVAILGPLLLQIDVLETLLLGSVLAAVSPAIVVPRMIKLKELGYGEEKNVSQLIMTGAACDDIFVIVLFYAFNNIVISNTFDSLVLLQIPTSIILGITVGLFGGFVLSYIFKLFCDNTILKIILMLGSSFFISYIRRSS